MQFAKRVPPSQARDIIAKSQGTVIQMSDNFAFKKREKERNQLSFKSYDTHYNDCTDELNSFCAVFV